MKSLPKYNMYRFFKSKANLSDDRIIIDDNDFEHITRSLRLNKGDIIHVVIERNTYKCSIDEIYSSNLVAKIHNIEDIIYESPLNITLYQGLCKGDKFEYIIQKSVELGVNNIVPFFSSRTIVKLTGEKAIKKIERYNKISESAAKQSKRQIIPVIHQPLMLENIDCNHELGIVLYENEQSIGLSKILQDKEDISNVGIVIGPEGGFSEDEIFVLRKKNFKSIKLGPRILRTETAPLAIISILQHIIGDMN